MIAAAVETKSLKKIFSKIKGQETLALDDVSLRVDTREIFALLGPNGAGKTTLIKILAGLVLADGGQAKVFGYDVAKNPKDVHKAISLVLGEERSFYWRLTGLQNLEFFGVLYNLSGQTLRKKIEKAANLLDLHDLDKPYQQYSTGNKFRLALARSFLNDAKLLFMDEPTKSLDPGAASKLRTLMKRLSREEGKTIFFATHDTEEAEEIADRMAVIDQGAIKGLGSLKDLQRQIANPAASLNEIFNLLVSAP
ncbi:MAG: hypothetical protein AUJ72_00830 [Candidatus Omnitrophica bacterium CG1_02_46_14]|nr:MAG: hypothetical protein AUJ72_00830 [Candidatus Omnitrophica bacterium CG1_02_46_14]